MANFYRQWGVKGPGTFPASRGVFRIEGDRFGAMLARREQLVAEPFVGVTTDGQPILGLYPLEDRGRSNSAMVDAARSLLALLTPAQSAVTRFPIDANEWRRWENGFAFGHAHGLLLDDLDDAAREAALAIVAEAMSTRGYETARNCMRLNETLAELTDDHDNLGEWIYRIAIFGEPSVDEPWGWHLWGHHVVVNCFVFGSQIVLTPMFLGAEPAVADDGKYAGVRELDSEQDGGLELVRSLSDSERARAILAHSLTDPSLPEDRRHPIEGRHHGGAGADNLVEPYQGIRADGLSRGQRELLLDLLRVYTGRLRAPHDRLRIEEVEQHLDDTHFAWIGGIGDDDPFYYKIQSPVVLVELDHHRGVFITNDEPAKHHVHTIVRTPNGHDYGMDWLRLHYAQTDHGRPPPGRSP